MRRPLAILAMLAGGYALTLLVFYPGVMTWDARYVYQDIAKSTLGDWQSPVMTVLWTLIDPIAPGPASMFLLMVTLYWLAIGLLAITLARRSLWPAVALVLLALSPPAFALQGIIWRDVLFANTWLLAAALAFAAAESRPAPRLTAQGIALALLALGVLLRPNAIFAAPVLATAILWPLRLSLKRAAFLYVPFAVAMFMLVQLIYYGALGATRQHAVQSIMVFDLGGISHFSKRNQFPVEFDATETALLLDGCYQPTLWDIYWRLEPCQFVMRKLEREEKLFGTPAVRTAWLGAILRHPLAYLQHRTAFMWNFLAGNNLVMWTFDVYDSTKSVFADRPAFNALVAVQEALKATPLLRAGTWLIVCVVAGALAWRRRDTPAGVYVIGTCASAAIYVLTYFGVGVASDYRYAYWAVLAGMTGAVAVAVNPRPA
jgi:hypothetical protein